MDNVEQTKKEKLKQYLQHKIDECNSIILKRRRKNRYLRGLYITLVASSVIGSSVVVLLSSLAIPPIAVGCVSAVVTVTSALSLKFNIQDKKNKLAENIRKLNQIKDKLDYIANCNGNLTECECDAILEEFRYL